MRQNNDAPRDRDELLRRMEESRLRMVMLFDNLGEEALTGPRDAAGWTAKDHFYHLAVWRQIQLARMRGEPEHAVVGLPDEASFRAACATEDFWAINAHIAGRGRALAPMAVRALLAEADDAIRAEILGRDFASLFAETRSASSEGGPLVDTVIGNTYAHDAEHRQYIMALVGQR